MDVEGEAVEFSVCNETPTANPCEIGGWGFGDATVVKAKFAAAPPPTVTAVNPNAGPQSGGTEATITGTDFTAATDVEFGSTPAASFSVEGPTEIKATTSAHAAGTVDITVTTPSGTSPANPPADQFEFLSFAETEAATDLHHTDVVLHGHLDPFGDPEITNCQFDWGTDTSYTGGSVPCDQGSSFTEPADVSALLNNLVPGATYHYRLVVSTSAHGESFGDDQTVTPPPFAAHAPEELTSFGPDGTEGSSFGSAAPRALAFGTANDRLYVNDNSVPGLYGFDASSPPTFTPVGAFNPLPAAYGGSQPRLAVDNSGLGSDGNVYYSSRPVGGGTGLVYGFDSSGAPLGGNFPIDTATNPGGTVGSPHFPLGLAVDSAGGLWVSDFSTKYILHYSSAGVFQDSIDISSLTPGGYAASIAFDSADDLYAAIGSEAVWKLTAASGYSPASATQLATGLNPIPQLAVDLSSGDFFVIRNGEAFPIEAFSSSGSHLYDFGGDIAGSNFAGIAVDPTTHYIYVADRENRKVHVFTPGLVQRAPTVTQGGASAITGTAATLNAKVDPEGIEVTDCHFELVPSSQFEEDGFESVDPEEEHPCEPDPGSGSGDVAVHADISGLGGGSVYHFRIVAESAEGFAAQGPNQTLTTHGPQVREEAVEAVGTSDATVSAKISPAGEAGAYRVEYGTTSVYGQSTATLAFGFDGDESPHTVSAHITGLDSATVYHFRFIATNPGGTGEGADATFATYGEASSFGPCANDSYRSGFGAHLPDCRAYEQATPIDKHGANVQGDYSNIQASSKGDHVDFLLLGGLASSGGSSVIAPYLASRGPGGWSSDGLLPPTSSGKLANVFGWSADMSASLSRAPAAGESDEALYLRDSLTGAFVQSGPAFPSLGEIALAGFADSSQQLIFESEGPALTPDAVAGKDNLYGLDHGALSLLARVPAGSATSCDDEAGPSCEPAPEGSFAGPYYWKSGTPDDTGGARAGLYTQNTLSRDGSKAFFTAAGSGRLYMRERGAKTTWVSASQRGAPDPNGEKPVAFMAATPDGSTVFFASCEKLTDDSTAVSTAASECNGESSGHDAQGSDLYSYETATGDLTDLTVDHEAGDERGAGVQGVVGASEDGSRVYFVADGVLAPGATPGDCTIRGIPRGGCNLYLAQGGTTTFIARLQAESDHLDWAPRPDALGEPNSGRVSADGSAVLFSRATELYRYSATAGRLDCVSCAPAGLPSSAAYVASGDHGSGANVVLSPKILTRNLSADGDRAFFETSGALLNSDTNGVSDVYEWEAKGSGSCESEAQGGGCLYLISSGRSSRPSYFADASADGDHVFFFTPQALVPSDEDELIDIYDAAVDGGVASQHALSPPTCSGTSCQANPAPPPAPSTASSSFRGPGNLSAARPGANRCQAASRQARKLSRRARVLRRRASRTQNSAWAKRLRSKAHRLAKGAHRRSSRAKRCRKRLRGAGSGSQGRANDNRGGSK